tara:strand:+ start:180 stop:500 length:321 start_codon:yes stop_codon:yes gene_type:complete
MAIQSIKEDSFEKEVVNSELPVLIDFWAEWCGPCKEMNPILEEVSSEMEEKIKVLKINIDENPNIPNKYGVQSIPTLIIFKKGEAISTKVGASIKSDLITWIDSTI